MTAAELIEKLQELPPDTVVTVGSNGYAVDLFEAEALIHHTDGSVILVYPLDTGSEKLIQ